jgi:AcrR family transcriptional regulator
MKSARRKREAAVPASEPRDVTVRSPRSNLVEGEIFERATKLFAERGFSGTSLQDIADAMGMTRPALYYYVKNKDELLVKLVAEITESPARKLALINGDKQVGPLDRLRAMTRLIVGQVADDPSRFLLLVRSEANLPPEIAQVHVRGRKRVLAEFVAVIEDAVSAGLARPVDSRVAALGIIGLSNWVAWWHHPKDGRTAEEIGDELAEMAVQSIAQTATRTAPGVEGAIKLLRQDLEYLERAHRAKKRGAPRQA